jgi:hypothetical protein
MRAAQLSGSTIRRQPEALAIMRHGASGAHARWPRVADACAMVREALCVCGTALVLGAAPDVAGGA